MGSPYLMGGLSFHPIDKEGDNTSYPFIFGQKKQQKGGPISPPLDPWGSVALPGGVVALYHVGLGHAFTRSPKGLGLLGGGFIVFLRLFRKRFFIGK